MPGELALYRDYKPTDVSEYASAAARKSVEVEVRSKHHAYFLTAVSLAGPRPQRPPALETAVTGVQQITSPVHRIHRAC
jgi:hypothetical protein